MNGLLAKIVSNLKKSWQLILICITITVAAIIILSQHFQSQYNYHVNTDFIYMVESKVFDFKLRNRGTDTSETKVGILAIDERSLTKFGRWPFSRKYYARAFKNLKKLGVKWIGFDVVWSEPEKARLEDATSLIEKMNASNVQATKSQLIKMDKRSPSDDIFIEALKDFKNIILGYFYFGSEQELKASRIERDPFQGLDLMMNSAIEGYDIPEGYKIQDYKIPQAYGLVANTPEYSATSDHFSFFNNDADEDAINRWVTLFIKANGVLMPSLALKTAAEYLNSDIFVFFNSHEVEGITLVNRDDEEKAIEIPLDTAGFGRILVNHRGGAKAFHHFSLADAYDNSFSDEEKKMLKDSVLLLGPTATGINDLRPNPFDPAIDGVENHAAVVDNIIRKNFLSRPSRMFGVELAIIVAIGLFFSPLVIWGHAIASGIAVFAFLSGFFAIDYFYWFKNGVWAYLALPCTQILSMFIATNIFKYISEEKDKQFLKKAFGSYISPELIEEMHDKGEPPKLGGDSGIRTAYFTDIQGFSSFSEKLTATQLVELLNEYLTAMTDILLEEKGTLDKYEGDAIIAFFGAPMPLEDHAYRACLVALKMQSKLDDLREKWTKEGDKWPKIVHEMRMRIGINSGEIVTGNMGSRDRMNYTMMGDSVNLAARLEEAAKQYGIFTQVSGFTKDLTDDKFEMRELDTIRVVGKQEPVVTYDLLGRKGTTHPILMSLKDTFHEGIALYKQMKWDEAIEKFKEAQEFEWQRFPSLKGKKTNPSEVYINRCEEFKKNPPPENWDGVYTLTSK